MSPEMMNAQEMYSFLRESWQTDEAPSAVAKYVRSDIRDVTAFYNCMERDTEASIRGARAIAGAIVGIRA